MQEEKETRVKSSDEILSFKDFCERVRKEMREMLGSLFRVSLNAVPKNNGIVLQGLTIREAGENVVPTIYLESFYKMYVDGCPLDEIEDDILRSYTERNEGEEFDVNCFSEWQKAKERITFKLVNAEKNRELLLDVPHRRFLDFVILYEYCFDMSEGRASVLIRNAHMAAWGVSEDVLHDIATVNATKLFGWQLCNMETVLLAMMAGGEAEMKGMTVEEMTIPERSEETFIPLYVLTNRKRFNGAACMLDLSLLARIAEKWNCDLCVIPSSIHEVILVPMDRIEDCGKMSQMVREVNATQLLPEEVLSDHAYLYSRETGELTVMEEGNER